jgi:hypothetical protein
VAAAGDEGAGVAAGTGSALMSGRGAESDSRGGGRIPENAGVSLRSCHINAPKATQKVTSMVTAIQWGLRACMAATVNAEDEDFMNGSRPGRRMERSAGSSI